MGFLEKFDPQGFLYRGAEVYIYYVSNLRGVPGTIRSPRFWLTPLYPRVGSWPGAFRLLGEGAAQ